MSLLAFGNCLFVSASGNGSTVSKDLASQVASNSQPTDSEVQVPQVQAKVRVKYHMFTADVIVRVDFCENSKKLFERLCIALIDGLYDYAESVKIGNQVIPYFQGKELNETGIAQLFCGVQEEPVVLIDEF